MPSQTLFSVFMVHRSLIMMSEGLFCSNSILDSFLTYLWPLVHLQYLTNVCGLPGEFALAVRKKIFMIMGSLDSESLIMAIYHVQRVCESQVELMEMLVRALKPLFEPSLIPKLTPLVALDEAYAQKVLMGLFSTPAPPIDVKPLSLETTESYIVAQLDLLYWSMLAAGGAPLASLPRMQFLSPLPPELQPDFAIVAGGTTVQCHSWILYGRWPWFRRLISSGLAESSSMTMSLPDDCWSLNTVKAFLRYLYTNSVDLFESGSSANELLETARLFDLLDIDNNPTPGFSALIEHCNAPYSTNPTVKTAVSSYQRLLLYGSSSQRKHLRKYISQSIDSIMSDDKLCAEFATLGAKVCAQILFQSYERDFPSGASTSSNSGLAPNNNPGSSLTFSSSSSRKKDSKREKSPSGSKSPKSGDERQRSLDRDYKRTSPTQSTPDSPSSSNAGPKRPSDVPR